MVPEPVTSSAAGPTAQLRRVGPGGSMAADSAFAVALLTLWHEVAQAGAAVGFAAGADRSSIGPAVAPLMDLIKSGRTVAVARTDGRRVVGVAMVERGVRDTAHTGTLFPLLVHPAAQRQGAGTELVREAMQLAAASGIERIRVAVPADAGLERFFARFGFVDCGRLPSWIRREGIADTDEVLLAAVNPPVASGNESVRSP